MPSSPCPDAASLRQLLEGALPETRQAALYQHLETCVSCRAALDKLATEGRSFGNLARELQKDAPAPEPGLQRVLEQAAQPFSSETQAETRVSRDEDLAFLAPSSRPGHLGRLGHYEIQEAIGKGGFGIVLKAFDEKLHRVVAIKVLSPQVAASGTARKRFTREARAAAAVTHDHVVTIHAVEDEHNPPYLVMQCIEGVSLQEKLDQDGPLGLREILRIGLQTAEGLAAAHKQGLVHRDIKPANILLENGVERVKITDFGLARAVDDASLTQSGVVAGTPMFMAPEQAMGEAVDHRADLFSLGSVLYVMCTGRPPFRATGTMAVLKRVIDDTPRPIRESNHDIPDWLSDIITKLHAKKPAERFQSAREVADVLGQHLAELQFSGRAGSVSDRSKPAGASPPVARASGSSSRRPALKRFAVVVALLSVVIGAGIVFWPPGGGEEVQQSDQGPPKDKPPPASVPEKGKVGSKPPPPAIEKDKWVQLFNGKDLKGWTSQKGQASNWKVVNRAITCSGPGDNLYTERDDFANFHLRAEVKINAVGNSGIWFRAEKRLAEDLPLGYEAQVTNNPDQHFKTGSLIGLVPLIGLVRVAESPVPADTWFTYEIIADGNHIRLLVNDKETADYTDVRPKRRWKGHLALQHMDEVTQVHYRKIEIKELPPTPPDAKVEPPAALPEITPQHRLPLTRGKFTVFDVSQDGRYVLAARSDVNRVRVWEIETGKLAAEIVGQIARFTPDSRHFISTPDWSTKFRVHELPSGKIVRPFGFRDFLFEFSLSSKGTLLLNFAPTDADLWDWESGKRLWKVPRDKDDRIFFIDGGKHLLFQKGNTPLRVWETDTRKEVDAYAQIRNIPWLTSISRDERRLLCVKGVKDRRLIVYDVKSGKELLSAPSPVNPREALSDDGSILATASTNERDTLTLWDVDSKRPIAILRLPEWVEIGFRCHVTRSRKHAVVVGRDEAFIFRLPEKTDARTTQTAAPFVIIAGGKKTEERHPTLAAAVTAAQSGDTIEIRGDGPFVMPSLVLEHKALRIQAGTGFRPRLTQSLDDPRLKNHAFIFTNAALALEGLTIERLVHEPTEKAYPAMVYAWQAPLHLSHCRLVAQGRTTAVYAGESSGSTVAHCEFQGNLSGAVSWDGPRRGEFVMESCVAVANWSCLGLLQHDGDLRNVRLRVRRNTFVAVNGLGYGIYGPPATFIDKRPDPKVPELDLDVRENVIDASEAPWLVSESGGKYQSLEDYPPMLPRLLTLKDELNVYSHPKARFLILASGDPITKWLDALAKLEDWNKLWGIVKPTSLEGVVRFEGGDLRKKGKEGRLVPADFRLAVGSPGKGKGPGGKDLGADVDKVGPGKPYEKWKTTADYKKWRKETDALLAGTPIPEAGKPVVLAKFGPAVQPLIKAVAEDGGWRFDFDKAGTYKVFQVPVTAPAPGRYIYQVEIKSKNVEQPCSLHRGHVVEGKEGGFGYVWHVEKFQQWSSRQIASVFLRQDEQPTALFLELTTPGSGTIWIRNVQFSHEQVATPEQQVEITAPDKIRVEPQGMQVLNGHAAVMALSPDGKTLALVGYTGKLRLWHLQGKQWQPGQTFPVSRVDPVGFSPDGAFLVSGQNVFAKAKEKWKQVATVPYSAPGLAFSPDSKVAFRNVWSSDINAYRLPQGKALEKVKIKEREFLFKDQGQLYARAVHDRQMGVWRIEVQGKELFAHDHFNSNHVVAAKDGMTLATSLFSPIVNTIWKKDKGQWKKHMEWPTGLTRFALGMGDQVLATGSEYGWCQLRDIATGEELATLRGHQGGVFSLAFGPDGTLYTSSADGHVGVWKIKLLKPPPP